MVGKGYIEMIHPSIFLTVYEVQGSVWTVFRIQSLSQMPYREGRVTFTHRTNLQSPVNQTPHMETLKSQKQGFFAVT